MTSLTKLWGMHSMFIVRSGGILHESIYRSTLGRLCHGRGIEEVSICLSHEGFKKELFMDLVVDGGCPFELKVVSSLTDKHRTQLIQYLMLTELSHGKLINFGGEQVEHEFVNCHETTEHRRSFEIHKEEWHATSESGRQFERIVIALVRDWGTGLDRSLYLNAIVWLLGGPENVYRFVNTVWEGLVTGRQPVALLNSTASFVITTNRQDLDLQEMHLRRFLMGTELETIHWVNIVSGNVQFKTLRRNNEQK